MKSCASKVTQLLNVENIITIFNTSDEIVFIMPKEHLLSTVECVSLIQKDFAAMMNSNVTIKFQWMIEMPLFNKVRITSEYQQYLTAIHWCVWFSTNSVSFRKVQDTEADAQFARKLQEMEETKEDTQPKTDDVVQKLPYFDYIQGIQAMTSPLKRIDQSLARYYEYFGRNDYLNDEGFGTFLEYCHVNDLQDFDAVEDELEDVDSCVYLDFDEQFPFTEEYKQKDDHQKQIFIFNLLSTFHNMYKQPKSPNTKPIEIYRLYIEEKGYGPQIPKHLMAFARIKGLKIKFVDAKNIIANPPRMIGNLPTMHTRSPRSWTNIAERLPLVNSSFVSKSLQSETRSKTISNISPNKNDSVRKLYQIYYKSKGTQPHSALQLVKYARIINIQVKWNEVSKFMKNADHYLASLITPHALQTVVIPHAQM
eukprot:206914_1